MLLPRFGFNTGPFCVSEFLVDKLALRHGFLQVLWLIQVAGSVPGGVCEIFIDLILPAALWPWLLTQALTGMSTRDLLWGLTVLPPSCAGFPKIVGA